MAIAQAANVSLLASNATHATLRLLLHETSADAGSSPPGLCARLGENDIMMSHIIFYDVGDGGGHPLPLPTTPAKRTPGHNCRVPAALCVSPCFLFCAAPSHTNAGLPTIGASGLLTLLRSEAMPRVRVRIASDYVQLSPDRGGGPLMEASVTARCWGCACRRTWGQSSVNTQRILH